MTGTIFTDTASGAILSVDANDTLVLDNVTVNGGTLNNAGTVQVDAGDKLTLSGVTINGGTINDFTPAGAGGTIEIKTSSSINGTTANAVVTNALLNNGGVTIDSGQTLTLDNVTVTGTIFTDTASGAILSVGIGDTLMLQNGVTVNGGTINIDGTLEIEASTGATLNGVNITGTGNRQIDDAAASSILVLAGGTTMTGGKLTVGSVGALEIGTALGATLNSVSVINYNVIEVLAGSILTLDLGTTVANAGSAINIDAGSTGGTVAEATLKLNGATINGGTLADNGTIDVTDSSSINGITAHFHTTNASLNGGKVKVESGATLTLDNVTVNGTTFNDSGSGATIQIDAGTTLTLYEATIDGGTINDYSSFLHGFIILPGTIDVTGSSKIDSNAVLNNGNVTVESGVTLKLDDVTVNGTTFTDTGTVFVDSTHKLTLNAATITGGTVTIDNTGGNGTLLLNGNSVLKNGKLVNSGQVNVSGSGNEEYNENVTANYALEVLAGAALLLDHGTAVANTGTITVDVTATLTLDAATIDGGTINDYSLGGHLVTTILPGLIDVTGSSKIDGNATLNNGNVTVESGVTLKLDNVTVNGTAIADHGTIQVDGSNTLTLDNVIITGGAVADGGTTHIDSGKTLTLDNVTVTGGAITDNGTIQVDSGKTLTLDNVTVTGGAITDNGTIHVDSFKTLTLDNVTVTGGAITDNGTIHVDSFKTLTLDNVTVTGGSITNSGTIQVDSSDKLTLNDVSVSGGITNDNGTIVITGGTTIANNTTIHGTAVFEIDASAKNETLTHYGSTDTFVFNFAGVGHDIVSHFDVTNDALQFSSSIFAYAASHIQDSNGNAVITLDPHGDTITLTGVHVSQLQVQASDFHIV